MSLCQVQIISSDTATDRKENATFEAKKLVFDQQWRTKLRNLAAVQVKTAALLAISAIYLPNKAALLGKEASQIRNIAAIIRNYAAELTTNEIVLGDIEAEFEKAADIFVRFRRKDAISV